MKPRDQKERLVQLIESSVKTLAEQGGYRLTQIADIAAQMGVSPGTVYLYVTSKEDLYHFLVEFFFLGNIDLEKIKIPIKMKSQEKTLKKIKELSLGLNIIKKLEAGIAKKGISNAAIEFEDILKTLYKTFAQYRHGITLLRHSSLIWPELGVFYINDIRLKLFTLLSKYLKKQMSAAVIKLDTDIGASAQLILESMVYFAVYRHNDLYPVTLSEEIAEKTIVNALLNAFIKHE